MLKKIEYTKRRASGPVRNYKFLNGSSIECRVPPALTLGGTPQRTQFACGASKKALTLIELLVAVSILTIGIVVVLQSFITIVSALDTSANQIKAMHILEVKMYELEQNVLEEGGMELIADGDKTVVGVRQARWELTTELLVLEKPEIEEESESGDEEEQVLVETILRLVWQEGDKEREAVVGTYFSLKEEEEVE